LMESAIIKMTINKEKILIIMKVIIFVLNLIIKMEIEKEILLDIMKIEIFVINLKN
jgi:hypothetical protein